LVSEFPTTTCTESGSTIAKSSNFVSPHNTTIMVAQVAFFKSKQNDIIGVELIILTHFSAKHIFMYTLGLKMSGDVVDSMGISCYSMNFFFLYSRH
jgi:hypothetical protein